MFGTPPIFKSGTVPPTEMETKVSLRKLRSLAGSLNFDTEEFYCAMGNVTLWGSDTQEDFGDKRSVCAQVKMLFEEATMRLGYTDGYALTERVIRSVRLPPAIKPASTRKVTPQEARTISRYLAHHFRWLKTGNCTIPCDDLPGKLLGIYTSLSNIGDKQ